MGGQFGFLQWALPCNRFAFPFLSSHWQVMAGICIENIKMQSKMTFPVAMRCFYYPFSSQNLKAWTVMQAFAHYELAT